MNFDFVLRVMKLELRVEVVEIFWNCQIINLLHGEDNNWVIFLLISKNIRQNH